MRRLTVILAGVFLCAVLIATARAQDGRDTFVSKCGSCHRTGGEAERFAPTKYASTQWERFFRKNKHTAKKDISGQVSPADLERVKDYLVEHAADSDQPEAVGLR